MPLDRVSKPEAIGFMSKARIVEWLGYEGEDAITRCDAEHDPLHRNIAAFMGLTSHAMRQAAGEVLTGPEQVLAGLEETAILSLQKWQVHARKLS